jgi:AT-rich interactive domain-containing protein 1
MDDDNNTYRSKPPSAMMVDQHQQQQQPHHPPPPPPSSTSTNGPKSPSGTSMSSYVPDDADSSNSSFPDSPPPSHEKGQTKRKLSSATSNSHTTPAEVFTKLRDMGDETERQERHLFVDRLQKLWEENQIVCRNLPSISKQTIDLYRLYTCVREQNGFQEFSKVAKNRHWRDIASKLNIPNSSSAAFNVKQKYINLKLFHYECKFDRGGINPEPILAEIEKQQGKRSKTPKKAANNSGTATNNTNENTNDGKLVPSQGPPQSQTSILPPQQQPQQPVQDPYRGYPPPQPQQGHPHQMGHPQQQYRPMQMPMHPYGSTGNEMQPPYDPSTGGQMMYTNPEMDYQRTGYPPAPPPPGQQQQPPQMMKPLPPNAYGMPPPQVQQSPASMPPQHRPTGPYPSIASKPQQQMVPSSQPDYNVQQTSNLICAPPNQQAPPQPPPVTGPQQTYHYQPQQPMPR